MKNDDYMSYLAAPSLESVSGVTSMILLFYLGPTPPSFATVHLTWNRESRREWPYTELFETVEDWVERGMKPAAIDYEQSHQHQDGAAEGSAPRD